MVETSSWCPWNRLKFHLANDLRKLTECNCNLGFLTNTVSVEKVFLRAKSNTFSIRFPHNYLIHIVTKKYINTILFYRYLK